MTGHGVGLKGPAWEPQGSGVMLVLFSVLHLVQCSLSPALSSARCSARGSYEPIGLSRAASRARVLCSGPWCSKLLSGLSFLSIWENGTR